MNSFQQAIHIKYSCQIKQVGKNLLNFKRNQNLFTQKEFVKVTEEKFMTN